MESINQCEDRRRLTASQVTLAHAVQARLVAIAPDRGDVGALITETDTCLLVHARILRGSDRGAPVRGAFLADIDHPRTAAHLRLLLGEAPRQLDHRCIRRFGEAFAAHHWHAFVGRTLGGRWSLLELVAPVRPGASGHPETVLTRRR